jgi:hypothetical protein
MVLLTSSSQPLDIAAAYARGADGYRQSRAALMSSQIGWPTLIVVCYQPRSSQGQLKVRG